MRRLRAWFFRLAGLFNKERQERDLATEIEGHLQMHIEDNLRCGMTPEEARREALLKLGGIEPTKENYRDRRGVPVLEALLQDLRYGLRVLRKNPGVTLVAVVTLALGIGANTTIFSVVSVMLLRKPPVHDPDRVMMLLSRNPANVWAAGRSPVSAPDFIDWRTQNNAFTATAAAAFEDLTLSGGTEPERVAGARVSADYFRVLGVSSMLGRTFLPGEDQVGQEHVVVLSEGLWRRRLAGDSQVMGRTLKINGDDHTVIGIMPARLQGWYFPAQLWVPLVFTQEQLGPSARKSRFLYVYARRKPDVDEGRAQAQMTTIAGRIAEIHPDSNKGWGANVMSVQEYMKRDANVQRALAFLMATVGLVLLIACANLANLLLARNSARQREFAIRSALGAGRLRLARQLLSECLLLSVAGSGCGLLLTFWGIHALRAGFNWNEKAASMASEISIDGRVLAFTLLVSVVAAIVSGLAPAIQISRPDLNAGLKENSRTTTAGRERHRLQSLLVMGELALSVILLVAAGLFVKGFIEEMQASLGINPHNVLTASVSLSGPTYKDVSRQAAFFENVLRQLDGFPQAQSAAVTSDLPFTFPRGTRFTLEGRPPLSPNEQPSASHYVVSPGYFETVEIPLLQGRTFKPPDDASSTPVAVVNETFARKFFPNQSPLGRHISVNTKNTAATKWSEIVGVVGDVDEFLGQAVPRPHIYEPFLARPAATMNLVVRTRTEPGSFAGSLRRAVWAVDKDRAVNAVRTMDRVVEDSGQGDGLMAELMGAFAGVALLMATIGIYCVLTYLVGQRTHEIGVRMALGARRNEVLRLVMGNAMSLVLTGVGVGFLVSLSLPRLVTASFPSFRVHSGWILTGTPLTVMLVALACCYLPARRATKVDPLVALRCE